jgi:hypothetical protein
MTQRHRFLHQILRDIASQPTADAIIFGIRESPRAVKQLLLFTFGPHIIDLPTEHIDVVPISTKAYTQQNVDGDDDLLMSECPRLLRIFAKGVNPHLTSKRRLEIYKDFLERADRDSAEILMSAVRFRRLPSPEYDAITPEIVRASGVLDELRPLSLEEQQARVNHLYSQIQW